MAQPIKTNWRTFYVPNKKFVGAGVKDRDGRIYLVHKDGALRLIKDKD